MKRIIFNILKHLAFLLGALFIPYLLQQTIFAVKKAAYEDAQATSQEIQEKTTSISQNIDAVTKKLDVKTPKAHYLVVNSTMNEFRLYKGKELIRDDKCSTGSYIMLRKGDEKQWVFKTPKGEFKIKNKITDPVWKKPDWAFIEEGLPVPSANHDSRFEYGVLGDYALYLGDGYMIHGTLYQRFLGMAVTHGCIRLNDENLELVYKSLPIGSKVYIY